MSVELILPCLRAMIGDWAYYVCTMSLEELSQRVQFASDIHKSPRLKDMIQRKLKKRRGKEIAHYLRTQKERFFNALVIGVYGGDPAWLEIGDVTANSRLAVAPPEEAVDGVGFLRLTGKEDLYALDGQHRLAGIKEALKDAAALKIERVACIFVAHRKTGAGLQRTRRLFTTLNKTARPVSRGEIIALDEDDLAAIVTRRLVDDCGLFQGERVLFRATNHIPADDKTSVTTIGALYDVCCVLLKVSNLLGVRGLIIKEARRARPPEEVVDRCYTAVVAYFECIFQVFPPLSDYRRSRGKKKLETVVAKWRHPGGGHVAFRPIGVVLITRAIEAVAADLGGWKPAAKAVAKLPMTLDGFPFRDVLWDSRNHRVEPKGRVLSRDVMIAMLGGTPTRGMRDLYDAYAKATGLSADAAEQAIVAHRVQG